MMGTKERAFAPLPPVSLEDLVPPDHFYRHLERTLDLGFVRDLVRDAYAESGRPSIDPVVFFKLQLILFFEGLRSERQLLRVVADRLSLRWYLGYDLTEPLPDHSSLTRIRERYGLDVFRRFFEAIVEQCLAAGLVWGEELYLDATKVEANAARDSLQPRFAVEAHLAHLFAQEDSDGDGEDRTGRPDGDRRRCACAVAGRPDAGVARRSWPSAPRTATTGSGAPGGPTATRRAGPTGARPTSASAPPIPTPPRCRSGTGTPHLGYQDHYVVDGGKARHHPDRPGGPSRGAGEPAGARPPVADALPLEAAAAAGHGRHQVRHRREHHQVLCCPRSSPRELCRGRENDEIPRASSSE